MLILTTKGTMRLKACYLRALMTESCEAETRHWHAKFAPPYPVKMASPNLVHCFLYTLGDLCVDPPIWVMAWARVPHIRHGSPYSYV